MFSGEHSFTCDHEVVRKLPQSIKRCKTHGAWSLQRHKAKIDAAQQIVCVDLCHVQRHDTVKTFAALSLA